MELEYELIIHQSENGIDLDNEIRILCASYKEGKEIFNSIVNHIPYYHEMGIYKVGPKENLLEE